MKKLDLTDEERREHIRQQRRDWRKNNPDKVKEQRERYSTKMREKQEAMKAAGEIITGKWSTGYKRGRPKLGEDRPPSKNAQDAKKYRAGNEKWREYNRNKQAEWSEKNPERRREISREYYKRRKERESNKDSE
jgi:hypothetical protein